MAWDEPGNSYEVTEDLNSSQMAYGAFYTPTRYDECLACGHRRYKHPDDEQCMYEDDEGSCTCTDFEGGVY